MTLPSFSELNEIYKTQILIESSDHGEKYEDEYKKSGKKSKDYDEDGEVEDEADEYAGVKDKAIKRKKKDEDEDDLKTESYSNWRSEINEIVSQIEPKMKDLDKGRVVKKNVKNKVVVNPSVSESVSFVDEQELDEEVIIESVNFASNYLFDMGLNEYGLEDVLESLGEDNFLEYIFYISEDYMLTEARRSGRIEPVTKSGKQIGSLKGAAKTASIAAKKREKAARTERESEESSSRPSGMSAALKRQSEMAKKVTTDRGNRAVKAAVATQPTTKEKPSTTKDKIARGILGIISGAQKQYAKGMERHRTAMELASKTAQTGANVARAASKGAKAFGSGMSSGVRTAYGLENPKGKETKLGRNVAAAAYKGARSVTRSTRDTVAKEAAKRRVRVQANENVQYILEKAVSEQQQKIFGLALAVKRGEVSREKVSERVLEIADGMSEAEIRKFASTKHKGIPRRVD
jgi:hypothetical protein